MWVSSFSDIKTATAQNKLVVVCIAEKWNKATLNTAKHVEELGVKFGDANLMVIDKRGCPELCEELNIKATPAIVFYWNGNPMAIKRSGWQNDDFKSTVFLI